MILLLIILLICPIALILGIAGAINDSKKEKAGKKYRQEVLNELRKRGAKFK